MTIVFEKAPTSSKSSGFFEANQYLLADSAFGSSRHCIPAFKRVRRGPKLGKDKEEFNKLLSKARVRVEHCIGLLKNRFQSLRNIRTVIYGKEDMHRIIDRVRVCVVLHNMLIGSTFPDEWVEPNEEDLDVEMLPNDEFDDEDEPIDDESNVLDRRQVLMNYLLH